MRNHFVALAVLAGIFSPNIGVAAAPPVNVLFAGTVERQYTPSAASAICVMDGTQSTFMRKATPVVAKLISLPDILIAPSGSVGPVYYTVGGQARLTFNPNNPIAGKIAFLPVAGNPAGVNTAGFNKYKEDYDTATGTLVVSFTIHFPDCDILVSATYRN